jgi:hypothetical protein
MLKINFSEADQQGPELLARPGSGPGDGQRYLQSQKWFMNGSHFQKNVSEIQICY